MMAELHSRGICLILRAYHANERLSLVGLVRITHDARYCNSVKMTSNECFTCQSISGEKRISPGPAIHEGNFWLVEHAYPCRLHHIHFHLVPKPKDLPDELKATRIFAMLHPEEKDAIPPDEIRKLCQRLRVRFEQMGHD